MLYYSIDPVRMARRRGSVGSSIRDDETWKTRSSEGDDERPAMHACAWSQGRHASDEAVMTRTRHFSEDEGRAASQREEARPCGLGMKRARDEAVLEVGAWSWR